MHRNPTIVIVRYTRSFAVGSRTTHSTSYSSTYGTVPSNVPVRSSVSVTTSSRSRAQYSPAQLYNVASMPMPVIFREETKAPIKIFFRVGNRYDFCAVDCTGTNASSRL